MSSTLKFTLASLAVVLSAGVSAQAALAKTSFVMGVSQEPTSLDPTSDATASIDGMLTQNVYESLTSVDEKGVVIPGLAESWTVSEDGLTYTFKLRAGVKFHDGTDFDAEDVIFSFKRAMAEDSVNPTKAIFAPIEAVTAIDPLTIEIKLKKKDAFLLFNLAQGDASIVAEETAATNNSSPVGTGPFQFANWTRGDRVTLEKNPNWYDAANVALEKVEFRFIADSAAAAAALMAEELDLYPTFPAPELRPQFENDPRFTVSIGSTEAEVILALNNAKAPFNDLRVRQGITYAIDRAEIIDGAMYGAAEPIGSFYPPHGPAYIDLTGQYAHNTEKAKELFKEAGIEGATLTMRVPPFYYATRSAEIIQAQLAEAGIDAKVENVEWGFWMEEVYKNHNYDMTIIAHPGPNDMGNFARGAKYYYGFDDKHMQDLWTNISQEVDDEKRYALLKEGQQYLADQAVHAFLFQISSVNIAKKGIEGIWNSSPVPFRPLAGVKFQ